jgi:ABC-type amino acid transport substrate-binding protein
VRGQYRVVNGPLALTRRGKMRNARGWFARRLVAGGLAIALLAVAAATAAGSPGNPYNLKSPGTLVVGMNLQYKPQMYLDANGKPAGYDVVLLKALVKDMKVKLSIKNLDFNGLIPGLVSKKFDMVSVGLSATPERKKAVSFSRAYVPYAQILAVRAGDTTPATIAAWNDSSKTITSLQGSTAEQLVQKTFPNATSKSFPDQNAAFLEVATGRADGIVVENYLLAQFNKSNPGKLKEAPFAKPLHVEYGSWAVQKGNAALVRRLNAFICKMQKSGKLAAFYKAAHGAKLPPMPAC